MPKTTAKGRTTYHPSHKSAPITKSARPKRTTTDLEKKGGLRNPAVPDDDRSWSRDDESVLDHMDIDADWSSVGAMTESHR